MTKLSIVKSFLQNSKRFLIISLFFLSLGYSSKAQNFFPLIPGFNQSVYDLCYDSTSSYLYASGFFTGLGDGTPTTPATPMYSISRWNGFQWDSLGSGATQQIPAMVMYNGNLLAGGAFNTIGGVSTAGLGLWNGTNWMPFANVVSQYGYGCVLSIYVNGTDLYVGGCYDSINGIPAHGMARYDGQNWHIYPPLNSGGFHYITSIIIYNNELYVGGNFDLGTGRKDIVKFDGTNWVSVGGGFSGFSTDIHDFAIFQNKLFVCGNFYLSTGDPGDRIAFWDGINWGQPGNGVGNGTPQDLFVFDNKLYIGGSLSHAGGMPISQIGVWDGMNWSNFNNLDFNNAVSCFASNGNNMFIGGGFQFVNGQLNRSVISYDMTTSLLEPISNCIQVSTIIDGKLLISSTCENSDLIKLQLINSMGQVVYKKERKNFYSEEIDLNLYGSGMFILNLITDKRTYSKKLVNR